MYGLKLEGHRRRCCDNIRGAKLEANFFLCTHISLPASPGPTSFSKHICKTRQLMLNVMKALKARKFASTVTIPSEQYGDPTSIITAKIISMGRSPACTNPSSQRSIDLAGPRLSSLPSRPARYPVIRGQCLPCTFGASLTIGVQTLGAVILAFPMIMTALVYNWMDCRMTRTSHVILVP